MYRECRTCAYSTALCNFAGACSWMRFCCSCLLSPWRLLLWQASMYTLYLVTSYDFCAWSDEASMNDMIDDNPSFVQKKKQERMYRKWYWYQVPSYIPVILHDKHEINQASLLSLAANKSSSVDPKTPFTMPEPNNNIFLTTENLAFSMPLILVCSLYVSEAIKQMLFEPIKLLVPAIWMWWYLFSRIELATDIFKFFLDVIANLLRI